MEKLNDKDYTGVMYNNWHFTLLIKGASKMCFNGYFSLCTPNKQNRS